MGTVTAECAACVEPRSRCNRLKSVFSSAAVWVPQLAVLLQRFEDDPFQLQWQMSPVAVKGSDWVASPSVASSVALARPKSTICAPRAPRKTLAGLMSR